MKDVTELIAYWLNHAENKGNASWPPNSIAMATETATALTALSECPTEPTLTLPDGQVFIFSKLDMIGGTDGVGGPVIAMVSGKAHRVIPT